MEEQGLASVATYGTGAGNTITHYYAGSKKSGKAKAKSNKNKKRK